MRLILFSIFFIVSTSIPFAVFILFSILYAFRFLAYELIFLGIILDSFFGPAAAGFSFSYTAVALGSFIVAGLVKPYLSVYD